MVLSSVTSSEADDAPGITDGETTKDIQDAVSGTADFDLRLRAERDGNGRGRTCTMLLTAEDRSGNVTTGDAIVFVPHDQGEAQTDRAWPLEVGGGQGMIPAARGDGGHRLKSANCRC